MRKSLNAWWRAVAKAPADLELRRVFADWLEEHGMPVLAEGQRYQAARGKWPHGKKDFHTNFRDQGGGCKDTEHFRLDPALMYHLGLLGNEADRGGRHAEGWGFGRYNESPITIGYATAREAEEMLARALDRLKAEDAETYELIWRADPYA
jgi:uncharacterized protein (TIGR02996 family)